MRARSGFFFVALAVSRPAHAGSIATLELTRDSGSMACPDAAELSAAVASRLGYDPFQERAALRVRVAFTREGGAYRGSVAMLDAEGPSKGARSLLSSAEDCRELAEAAALTVSILLDPRAGLAAPRPLPPPTPEPPPGPTEGFTPPPTQAGQAVPAEKDGQPPRPRFFAVAIGSIDLLPGPSFGVLAGGGVEGTRWSGDLELRAETSLSGHFGGREVTASFLAGQLVPCLRFSVARACAVAAFGATRPTVSGTQQGQETAFTLLVGPRAGVELPVVAWLRVVGHVEVLFDPTTTTLRAGGRTPSSPMVLWSTPVVSGLLGVGLAVSIP